MLQWTRVTDLRRVLFTDQPSAVAAPTTPAQVRVDVTFTQRASCQQPDRTFLIGATGQNWCVAEEIADQLQRAILKPTEAEAKAAAQEWRDQQTLLSWVFVGAAADVDPRTAIGAGAAWAGIALRWHAQSRRDPVHRNYYVGEGSDGWYWGTKIGHAVAPPRGPLPSDQAAKDAAQDGERSTP